MKSDWNKGDVSRRDFLRLTGGGVLGAMGAWAAMSGGLALAENAATAPPNIVLILTDDLAWSDLACYGSVLNKTPNLDRLARGGMRFTDAYASSSVCSPSRAALLTGKHPARLGMTDIIQAGVSGNTHWQSPENVAWLAERELTIARALKTAGYATAHIGKWHIGGHGDAPESTGDPTRYGFDVNEAGSFQGQPPDYFYPYTLEWHDGRVFTLPKAPAGAEGDFLPDRLTDEAIDFIRQDRENPFFLFMSYFLPHTSTGDRLQAPRATIDEHRARLGPDAPETQVVYAAMIDRLDRNVGRLMQALEAKGGLDNTLIVFTSDNGGHGGKTTNHPLRGAKGQVYEGGIRVPLFAMWRGRIPAGVEEATPVIGHDLFPTILDAAGVERERASGIDGVSLFRLLTGNGGPEREALYWHFPHFRPGSAAASVIRQDRYKLIEFYDAREPRLELYDLEDDLGEQNDLASEQPELVRRLQRNLNEWRTGIGARLPIPSNP